MIESSARRATMGKSNNKSSRSSSAKFKHRFSRMLLGSSCTTTTMAATTLGQAKLPSATPQRLESELFPDPDCRRRRKLDHHAPFSATDPRRLRHVAPVVSISINCGARRFVQTSDPFLPLENKEEEHDNERKTEAKQRSKRASETKKKTKRAEAKKLLPDAYGFIISSSTDSENQLDLLSSDEEEEESATLLSSNSFSSDSSEFYHNSRKKNTESTRRPARRHAKHSKELRPLVSIASKEREESRERRESNAGFAVVKRSSDPYSDFKSSMVELIVERGMHRARDLERLLDAYLSLNSHRHHQAILEAFADICEAMYGK